MTKYLVQRELPAQEIVEELGMVLGERFVVVDEDEDDYVIIQNGETMYFSKEPDLDGDSYATWFDVVTEVD